MDFLINSALAFVSTFFWMWILTQLFGKYVDRHIEDSVLDAVAERTVLVKVEQIADVVYLYNAQDGTFIGQGRTSTEIDAVVRKQNTQMVVIEGEQAVLDYLNDLVKAREISLSQ
jgi:hypothetical protein